VKRFTKKVMFLCDDETYNKLKNLADQDKSSMGRIIRELIDQAQDETSTSLNLDKSALERL